MYSALGYQNGRDQFIPNENIFIYSENVVKKGQRAKHEQRSSLGLPF